MKLLQPKLVLAMILTTAGTAPGVATAATPGSGAETLALGKCLVKTDRGGAISLFQSLPADASPVDAATLSSAGATTCGHGGATASAMQLRGAIAEALFARDFVEAGVRPHASLGSLAQLNLPEGTADTGGMFAAGRCVARARFADVEKLFAKTPGSRQESEFIDGLMPYFAACQPKGTQLSLKRSDVRPLLAQSAYDGNVRYWARQTASAR